MSLAIQDEAIRLHCQLRGWKLRGKVHTDPGISAWSGKRRPGLERAVALTCKYKAALVVYSLSRFSRSLVEADKILRQIQAAGGHMAIITMGADTSTPEGKLLFRWLSCMAEYESDRISAHTAAAHDHLKKVKGYTTMGIKRAGYKLVGGHIVESPQEQAVLAIIRDLEDEGLEPAEIAAALAARRVSTIRKLRRYRHAGAWTEATVRGLLQSMARPALAPAAIA